MDVVSSLRSLVSFWNVEAMVVGDRALPIGRVGRLLGSIDIHFEGQIMIIRLIHLLLNDLQLVHKFKCRRKGTLLLLIIVIFAETQVLVHRWSHRHLMCVFWECCWVGGGG